MGSSRVHVILISFQSTTPCFQCGVGARSYRTYRPSCRSLKMYGPVPAGLLVVPHLAFCVPLLLAEDHDVRSARVVERHVQTHDLAVHGDLVGVDHLDLLDLTDAGPVAGDRGVFPAGVVRVTPEGMGVDDILGRELAVAMMELHALVQLHPPGPPIGAQRPALRQPGFVLARLRVDLDEPLEHGIVLDIVIGRPVDPGAHVIQVRCDEPHHQAVDLGLPRRGVCAPAGAATRSSMGSSRT